MIGFNYPAEAGNLIVEGDVGIGTTSPEAKSHIKYLPTIVNQQSAPFGLLVETDHQISGAIGFKSVYAGGQVGYGRITYDADNLRFNFWSEWEGDYDQPASFGIPAGGVILWGGVSTPGTITRDAEAPKQI